MNVCALVLLYVLYVSTYKYVGEYASIKVKESLICVYTYVCMYVCM